MHVRPEWDLDLVLEAFAEPPYEPKHLTHQTFFLLAMASVGRLGELQSLVL